MRSKPTVAAVLFIALFSLPAVAQPSATAARPGTAPPRAGSSAASARPAVTRGGSAPQAKGTLPARTRVLRQRVGLSAAQAGKVERLMDRYAPEKRKAKDEIREARRALRTLLRSGSDDQKAYSRALDQLNRGHQALETVRNRELGALRKELTPKEQALLLGTVDQLRRQKNAGKARSPAPSRR